MQGGQENLLFVGTVDGSVAAYDSARLSLLWTKPLRDGPIVCLTNVEEGNSIVAATKAGNVITCDTRTGEELGRWSSPGRIELAKVSSLSGGRLLLAGSSIFMVDSTTGAKLGKWAGHPTPILGMATLGSSTYFCSAATGDRSIAIWDSKLSASGKLMKKSAIAQVSMNQPVSQVSLVSVSSAVFHVVAITLSGDVHVCKCTVSINPKDKSQDVVDVVEWAATKNKGMPVIQVAVDHATEDAVQLVLASGSAIKPRFSKISVQAMKSGQIAEIEKLNAQDTNTGLVEPVPQRYKHDTTSLPIFVAGVLPSATIRGKDLHHGLPNGIPAEEFMEEDMEDDQAERHLTFAERIAALKGNTADENVASTVRDGDDQIPKADSLSVLLGQAIMNEDKALLEKCLSVRNIKTVSKTARFLQVADAAKLLKVLVQKLQAAPKRGEQLTTWIRAILVHHAGYFAGTGACNETIAYLYQIVDTRLASYQSLVSLSGRLDLVVSTARYASQPEYAQDGVSTGPILAMNIDDEGDIEVEDALAKMGMEEVEEDDVESVSEDDGDSMDD